MCFFELLTFQHPFGRNILEIGHNISFGTILPISFPFSDEIQHLVRSMLISFPENRISLNKIIEQGFGPPISKYLLEQFEIFKQKENANEKRMLVIALASIITCSTRKRNQYLTKFEL
jgi:hypothetical protein